jgi:hypothetical protein
MKRGLAAAVAAASGLGACVEIPPYQGPILIGYSEDGADGAIVATPDVTLHFADRSRFHLPDQLQIDGVDVMGHATSPCWGESGTGFTVMPMPRVSGDPLDGGVQPVTSEFQATMRGPAVVQLKLDWSTRWSFAAGSACSTNTRHTSGGSSTFTMFPDGHIVRHDVLTEDNPDLEQLATGRCTCGAMTKAPDEFILSTYWAFDRARVPTQVGLGKNGPSIPDTLVLGTDYSVVPNYDTVCFDGPNDQYQVVSTWVFPPGTEHGPTTNAVAVGFDTLVSHDAQKQGDPKLELPWDVHGALFIERSNCPAALRRAIDYTAPQELTISMGSSTISMLPSGLDGIYGGDPGNGNAGIDVPDGPTTLSGGPSGSFVVWLRFPRSVIVPTATRAGASDVWYVPQRVDDRTWLLWFRDALQPDETITIRPN